MAQLLTRSEKGVHKRSPKDPIRMLLPSFASNFFGEFLLLLEGCYCPLSPPRPAVTGFQAALRYGRTVGFPPVIAGLNSLLVFQSRPKTSQEPLELLSIVANSSWMRLGKATRLSKWEPFKFWKPSLEAKGVNSQQREGNSSSSSTVM